MEKKSEESTQIVPYGNWTKRELEVLAESNDDGYKPISTTLASQMYTLFLEGYSCLEISKQNKGFTEADILYCRKKYQWDEQKDNYVFGLNDQIRQKLTKQKLESVEFLTNMLAVIHKEHRSVMLKFLQTGNPEDLPKIGSLRTYKEIVETLAKITGEDQVKKLKIDGKIQQDTNVKVEGAGAILNLPPEIQTKLLQALLTQSEETDAKMKGKKKTDE